MKSRTKSQQPIYVGTRQFIGRHDLVVSFYTQKCQFQCSYCSLPLRSAVERVMAADLTTQIDDLFDRLQGSLHGFRQLSFGNEGSALDDKRFHTSSLHRLLERAHDLTALEVLSIETRPEYINEQRLRAVRERASAPTIDLTVGFETQDDHLRQTVLRKNISRRVMEDRIRLLSDLQMRLTSYVMIKPAPWMTERDGVREAIATMEYLGEQCDKRDVELVIYLTPMYVADGSFLQLTTEPGAWVPPTIQSIFEVVVAGHSMGLPVYTGLWSEGLADEKSDFRGRDGYDPRLRSALVRFNMTGDISELDPVPPSLELWSRLPARRLLGSHPHVAREAADHGCRATGNRRTDMGLGG